MILIDTNPVIISAFSVKSNELAEPSLELVRHTSLNIIRSNIAKHKSRYGEVVLALDSPTWRKQFFQYYKGDRKQSREDSVIDWKQLFKFMVQIQEELMEVYPGRVVKVQGAEADDIIGVLTKYAVSMGEEVLIIASDNDMRQLLKFPGVALYSPLTKVTHYGPHTHQKAPKRPAAETRREDLASLASFFGD